MNVPGARREETRRDCVRVEEEKMKRGRQAGSVAFKSERGGPSTQGQILYLNKDIISECGILGKSKNALTIKKYENCYYCVI